MYRTKANLRTGRPPGVRPQHPGWSLYPGKPLYPGWPVTRLLLLGLLSACLLGSEASGPSLAADWITAPSYFTHDPQSGARVTQYQQIGPVYTIAQPDYTRSVYRQTRSSIQVAGSADHMHVVEQWGRPVRPYGEWRFPYRPYSVPYQAWGAPYAGLGSPYNYPFATPYGGYGPGHGVPNRYPSGRSGPYQRQQPPPYYDGNYAPYSRSNRSGPARTRRPQSPTRRRGANAPGANPPGANPPGANPPAPGGRAAGQRGGRA